MQQSRIRPVTEKRSEPYFESVVFWGVGDRPKAARLCAILQGSSNLAANLYRRLFKSQATEAEKMRAARLSVVIISVLSLFVAFLMTDIISAYQWVLRISTTTLVIPFLAVMFWRRVTSKGCASAMLSAIVVTVICPLLGTGIDPVIPGMLT
ncbi:sodium:solute symporter family transporter [Leisingera daeponensis]|uniref:sodium:solute symporter family transporter n=1 Tax=Leisingera daeponensis TaxID=405746 RepID=UPI0028F730BE|nr:hypothetical protein [Leisingera daeponensis]